MIGKRRLGLLAGPIAMVVLIASAGRVLWSSFERSKEASQWVEHTYRVLITSESFLSTLREVESTVRAYVITRNPANVAPYQAALANQASILDDLERLTRDNRKQQADLKTIRELTTQRLAVLARAEQEVTAGRNPLLSGVTPTGQGSKIMSELTTQVRAFEEEERHLLVLRNNAAGEAMSLTRFMLILTSSLLAVVLLFAGAAIERYVRNREAALEALRRQADLIDFSHDAIVTSNPQGVITGWNAGAVELYGWSSAEALGRRSNEILRANEADVALQIKEALSKTGRWDGELAQTTKAGQTRIVESRYVQVRNRAGAPIGVLNIGRDETQRKQAEASVRQAAEQRRLALDAAELGSWDYNVEQDSVTWDERCREIMGLPGLGPASFAQALKMVHPDERLTMTAAAEGAMCGKADGRFSQEMRIVLRDGSTRWLATHGRVYFDERNGVKRPVRVIGVNSDITERKRVEEALRESEDKVRVALETGRIGIFNDLVDESRIVFDERAKELLGLRQREDVAVQDFLSRVHPDDRERMQNARNKDLQDADSAAGELTYRVIHPSGDVRWLVARRRVYFGGEGSQRRAVRVLGVLLDITEQKRAEQKLTEALAESDRERGRLRLSEESLRLAHRDLEKLLEQKNILFQEVQHRVKNNLQIVSSLLSLEAQRFQDSQFRNALNESRDRIRSMALMHEKFYHLDDLARINFSEYVDELARYFFSTYIAEPTSIGFASDVDVKLSMGEAISCGLILQELLSNSVKHAFPEGKGDIRVDFHGQDNKFRLCYRDSGVGLPATVNLKNPATLGLQLVSDLALQLQGNLEYEYRHGAQFTLTFG